MARERYSLTVSFIDPPLPFSRNLINTFVGTIKRAYRRNQDSYDASIGHTIASFRFMLYESVKYYLPGDMQGISGAIVTLENNAIVVHQGMRTLRSYPVGTSEHDDPWTSFPNNTRGAPGAAASNADQLRLFSAAELNAPGDLMGLSYFLGHCGTPEAGLRAVHLYLPYGGFADERVRRYLQVWTVYRAGGDGSPDRGPSRPPPSTVPIESTPEPVVRLRDQRPADSPGE